MDNMQMGKEGERICKAGTLPKRSRERYTLNPASSILWGWSLLHLWSGGRTTRRRRHSVGFACEEVEEEDFSKRFVQALGCFLWPSHGGEGLGFFCVSPDFDWNQNDLWIGVGVTPAWDV